MVSGMIHPTAVVDAGAQLGADVRVWHFVHIDTGAQIGAGTSIGQGCYIAAISIGARCKIQNQVSLYAGVVVEDDVFIGPSCVFTNVQRPRAHLSRRDQYATTTIERGVTLGANATVVCGPTGRRIGSYAFVAAGAVVTKNVPPHAMMRGVPAVRVGWVCRCGAKLPNGTHVHCPDCGDNYHIHDERVMRVE